MSALIERLITARDFLKIVRAQYPEGDSFKLDAHDAVNALADAANAMTNGPWSEVRNALRLALQFAEDEAENRESAGGDMSDYINEAQDVADTCRAALKAATDLGA